MSTTQTPTKVKTGKVRASYSHVWEAVASKDSTEKKFQCVFLIRKKDKKTIADINAAIEAAKIVGRDKHWKGKVPAKLDICLRDGDEKFEEDNEKYKEYKDHYYVNAKSKTAPQVVKIEDGRIEAIINRDEFYSGVYCKATLNFFPYTHSGKNGIGCGLNNVLKVEDGENLGGGKASAEADFADEVEEDDDL